MNEFKVGLLAISTLITIVIMSLKITSNQSGFGEYVTYRAILRDASGIFPKTPIKVAGINAGRIKKIELVKNDALITFEVLKRVSVTEDSKLQVKTIGFLGDKYLEIVIGESGEVLAPESLLKSQAGAGIESLTQDAADALVDVKEIVRSIRDALAPSDGSQPIKEMLDDIKQIVAHTKSFTGNVDSILAENRKSLDVIITNLEEITNVIKNQLDENDADSVLAEVKDILDNAKKTSKDLSSIMEDIRNGKGTMGKLISEDQIADEVKDTLASVKKIVKRADAIRTELSVFSGVNKDRDGSTIAGLAIYPSPERFYLLGVKTGAFGPMSESRTTTITNGISSEELKLSQKKDSFYLNLQLGRKVHDWSFRGGLFESKGGVGVDYDLRSVGTKLTAEVYDFSRAEGINTRLASEVHFWNVIYGRVEGTSIFDTNRDYSVSLGLRFLDEDLKGIMGFLF